MPAKKTQPKKKTAKKKTAKSKGGRPSPFTNEMCEQARKLCLLGATDKDIADFFGKTQRTIDNWKKKHPQFFQSLKAGKDELDAQVEKSLFNRAMGYSHPEVKTATHEGKITDVKEFTKHYPPDTTAMIFWLKNRQPAQWRDKVEVEGSEDKPIKIIIGGSV